MRVSNRLCVGGWLTVVLFCGSSISIVSCRLSGGEDPDRNSIGDEKIQDPVLSLFGQPFKPLRLDPARAAEFEAKLDAARRDFLENPNDVDNIIWVGRRTAYLGRYREAIDIYSHGLQLFPSSAKLYRHRGHRFITVREFDNAVADLEKAADLTKGAPDQPEPDGIPNAANVPTSTNHSNIWYHLGLAYYLKRDFEQARRCYRECMRFAAYSDDMLCATSHWLYITCRRLGLEGEARRVLDPIASDMTILENTAYHRLLLMYRGEMTPESLLEGENMDAINSATLGYGVGNWHLIVGESEKAQAVFERVHSSKQWAAFGYVASEVELFLARG